MRPFAVVRHRRCPLGRAAAGAALALLLGGVAPAVGQDGAMYGARPAEGGDGDSSGAFVFSVAAGASVSGGIEVLNFTDEPATFDVYAVDAVTTPDDAMAPGTRDAPITGSAAWVTFGASSVEVDPRSGEVVSFTVAVPTETPAGDQLSALVVEPRTPTDRGNVAARTRIGLWLKLSVAEGEAVPGGGAGGLWGWPWSVAVPAILALLLWLAYATRDRRRRWSSERREERALVDELRRRRRLTPSARKHH